MKILTFVFDVKRIKVMLIPLVLCCTIWLAASLSVIGNMDVGTAAIMLLILITVQFISSVSDLYSKTISLILMITSFILGLLISLMSCNYEVFINSAAGGLTAFLVTWFFILVSKGQLGYGDLYLLTVTGFYSGLDGFINILFLSVLFTGTYSLVLVFAKKGCRKTEIPFAPFILLGTAVSILL